MNLYEMSHDFEMELDAFDALLNPEWDRTEDGDFVTEDGEVITPDEYRELIENRFRALDEMEENVRAKAENVACYIKNLLADAETMKAEEEALRTRRKAKENTAARLKDYLMVCMDSACLKKIDMPRAVISVKNNAESVSIPDEKAFINWAREHDRDDLLKFAEPTISKTAVKNCLKNGTPLPFAGLTRSRSVIIK
jgi:hypothetical protein